MTYEEKLKAAKQMFESQVELCRTLGFPEQSWFGSNFQSGVFSVGYRQEDREILFESTVAGDTKWLRRKTGDYWHLSTASEAEQFKWLLGGE